ncbi:MAG: restriction endonuclease [Epsilonproteobacteria bacterium]|nr:restriction endonuclease [Campylobacterota bacterium]
MTTKFEKLKDSFQESIFTWEYFTDFEKVKKNVKSIEKELNILNYLIGKKNIETEFINLIEEYPNIRKALPILIAIRKSKLKETPVITNINTLEANNKSYIFYDSLNDEIKKELLIFLNKSGLKDIFENEFIKNLVDYCFGVEVGFDTNARKNRTGKTMEKLCKSVLSDFANKYNLVLLVEATKVEIKKQFNIDVKTTLESKTNKNDRRFDFVIYNKEINKLFIFEVNYYSSSGSKPNSIAREYQDLYDLLKTQNIELIWITDGKGWHKMLNALQQTTEHNQYVININMLKNDILNQICLK